jgi:phosphoenolpyruvate carboxylase
VRRRFPYLDPPNHVQVVLLKTYRTQDLDERVLRGMQITIKGISAGQGNRG